MDFDHRLLTRHAFGLADPAVVEYLPEGVVSTPVVPASVAASAHLMPRLIDLRALSTTVRAELLDGLYEAQKHGEQPLVAMFVATELAAEAFAQHWNGMQIAAPAPGRKVWLRLHDPRVLHQLRRILSPGQRASLFSRIDEVTYWLGDSWLHATAADQAGHAPEAFGWDWPRIERIGAVNRALHGAGVRQAGAMAAQGALAEQLIAHAAGRHGLVDQADLVEFAVRGLLTAPGFDTHPGIAPIIRPSGDPDDDSRLEDRFALVGDDVWASLRETVIV